MNATESAIERMWGHLSEGSFELPLAEREAALSAGIEVIRDALQAQPDDAELHYHLGYLWYHWPERTEDVRSRIDLHLANATRLAPGHVGARLYQGFVQFDDGGYERALVILRDIPLPSLGVRGESWPRLKVEELILCCRMRIDWRAVHPVEIDELRGHYSAYKTVIEPPAPVEIARCATALCVGTSDGRLRPLMEAVARLIQEVEGDDGGALGPELRELTGWCALGSA